MRKIETHSNTGGEIRRGIHGERQDHGYHHGFTTERGRRAPSSQGLTELLELR
jgi:hypothetical protein